LLLRRALGDEGLEIGGLDAETSAFLATADIDPGKSAIFDEAPYLVDGCPETCGRLLQGQQRIVRIDRLGRGQPLRLRFHLRWSRYQAGARTKHTRDPLFKSGV